MRKIYVLVLLLLLDVTFLIPSDLSSGNFNKANRLYEDGKFSEALQVYLTDAKNGSHWKLSYNIGNCYFKLGRFVEAKIYYLKAERLKPFDHSIKRNIEIVNKRLNDTIPLPKSDFINRVILRIESVVSLNVVSFILVVFIIILNIFIFILFKKRKSRLIIYGISFSLLIVLLISGYHIYRVKKHNQRNTAVIIRDSELRSGPGENNTILFKVNPGIKVKIIDRSRDWFQVSASSDIAGWMKRANLEQI